MVTLTVDNNPSVVNAVIEILSRLLPRDRHLEADSGEKALEIVRKQLIDVLFLSVEIPGMSGIDTAEKIKELQPDADLVFLAANADYALAAFDLCASDYLLKPLREKKVHRALQNLRHHRIPLWDSERNRLKVQCFGFFEVWWDDVPIRFRRKRTKKLFAYLIDRKGAMCSIGQIISELWPDTVNMQSYRNQLRVFVSDLQATLDEHGIGEMLLRNRGELGIDPSWVDCDYYDYLHGSREARMKFQGEYMSQYSFGETTLAGLLNHWKNTEEIT